MLQLLFLRVLHVRALAIAGAAAGMARLNFGGLNCLFLLQLPAHPLLRTFFVVLEGGAQSDEDFSGGLKERLGLGFGDLVDVFAKVVDHFAKHSLNVARVNNRIAGIFRLNFQFYLL